MSVVVQKVKESEVEVKGAGDMRILNEGRKK